MLYRFDHIEVSTDRREVSSPEGLIPLRPRTFDLLVYLISHRSRVVPKTEILSALWPETVVSENSVAQCVNELRRALGDNAGEPRWVSTSGKVGYRFVGTVEEIAKPSGGPVQLDTPSTPDPLARVQPAAEPFRQQPHSLKVLLVALVLVASITGGIFWARNGSSRPETEQSALAMTSSLKAARAYLSAVELSRQYHPAEAIEKLQEALRLDPEFIMARARIGYVYSVRWLWEEKGRPYLEEAYARRTKLNELNRLYLIAWYDQAHRDYPGAIRDFRSLLAKFPRETEAREELGRILLGEESYDEARAELERAIRIDLSTAQAHNFLSALYIATHDFPRALAEAKQFVKLQPDEMNTHDTLGLAYEAANDFEAAEKEYRWILDRQPKFASRIHLANALYRMGRWRESKQMLERYIADAPSEAERNWGLDQLSVIALRQGNHDEVVRYARSQPADGYHDQEILLALHRSDLASAKRLLAARPVHSDRGQRANGRLELYVEGELDLAGHDPVGAVRTFQQAVAKRTPLYAVDWYEDCLANAYLRLGRFDEAITEYRRVLAIYPRLAMSWYGLAKAHLAKRQDEAAREAFQKMLEIWQLGDPEIPELAEARLAVPAHTTGKRPGFESNNPGNVRQASTMR